MITRKSLSRLLTSCVVIVFLALTIAPFDIVNAGGILYVTPGGAGDCSSWANACSLQTALTTAVSGNQIWVAVGTYKPAPAPEPPIPPNTPLPSEVSFELPANVAVYGGFDGVDDDDLGDRNPDPSLTILSGDLWGNDNEVIADDEPTRAENSCHVVQIPVNRTGLTLDGFTITGGNARPACADARGGGMLIVLGSDQYLMNLIFTANAAIEGGGIYNNKGIPILADVVFSNNAANNNGGGMGSIEGPPRLTNVLFENNYAGVQGGGLHNGAQSIYLINVSFDGNLAPGVPGDPPQDDFGYGGGFYNTQIAHLYNVTFSNNSASYGGGLAGHSASNTFLANVTFSGNSAGYAGGGIYSYYASQGYITNATFSGNSAATGGAMYNLGVNNNPIIRNSIFWGNTSTGGEQIYNNASTPVITDSVAEGGCPAGSACTNVINADPLLGTLQNNGGVTETMALGTGSSAIDIGNDTNCAADFVFWDFGADGLDQRGITRPQGAHCDIGAFEVEGHTLTVTSTHGAVTKTPDQATYIAGDVVQLAVNPDLGWSFVDWSGDLTGSDNPASFTIQGDATVTANYAVNTYTVTFDPQNGNPTFTQDVDYGALVTEPSTPTKTGHTFLGWFDAASGGTQWNFATGTMGADDMTLYGQWAVNAYTVTFDPQNGNPTFTQDVNYGALVTEPPTPTKTGHTFLGWFDAASGSTEWNFATDTMGAGDMTLYGQWAVNTYTVTFDPQNGNPTFTQDVNYGALVTEPSTPTKTGHTFLGWFDAASGGTEWNFATDTMGADDMPLYGQWSIITFSLTYSAGTGGTIDGVAHQTVDYGGDGSPVSAMPNSGYHFVDWSDGSAANPRTDTYVTANIIVAANFALDNQAPTNISLSRSSLAENLPVDTVVGLLSTIDPDAGDTHAYSFCGGADDASFAIAGNSLKSAVVFDFETKNSYNLCVRTTDSGGLFFDKNFVITIINVVEKVTIIVSSAKLEDGYILEASETSNTGSSIDSSATTLRLGDDVVRKQYRSILSFATGANLPDNAVITKVTLKLKQQGIVGGGNPVTMFQGFMVDIKKGIFGTSALLAGDWQATAQKTVGPFTPSLSGGWYTLNLTSAKAYINKLVTTGSGLTQIRLRFKLDDNNDAIANYLSLYSGEAGVARRPQLIIEYYVP